MGLLSFTREPVPETLSADMQQLNQLSAQQFSTLTEVVFQFLQEPKEVERFLAQLSEFAAVNKLSPGRLKNIVKSLLLVPNGALKRTLSAEQVRADLITLGLSEEKAGYFEEQWKEKSPTFWSYCWKQRTGEGRKHLHAELTLPQFYRFLHEMERMKTSLECLS
ncbi:COMM domain-containing protein 7-like [Rhineura floridana]|uniref:COMM domain-containing protein 7-like n=1 Tax=Rhineura floridana TaxID=261503 RepID=UPI002AC861E7|nr:COMM domain-containing protein 7-like [Rhineura floridana]